MKALTIPRGSVKPMSPADSPRICVSCRQNDARWIVSEETWCAFCMLYETEWGRSNAESRDNLIKMVEDNIDKPLIDINSGRLFREEADRIMMSVVMISSMKFE